MKELWLCKCQVNVNNLPACCEKAQSDGDGSAASSRNSDAIPSMISASFGTSHVSGSDSCPNRSAGWWNTADKQRCGESQKGPGSVQAWRRLRTLVDADEGEELAAPRVHIDRLAARRITRRHPAYPPAHTQLVNVHRGRFGSNFP